MAKLNFVIDKHLDGLEDALPAHCSSASHRRPRTAYVGPNHNDEDVSHVLWLAFERDATVVTGDGEILEKARGFGPCRSRGHYLGGVVVLPHSRNEQEAKLRAFKDGLLSVQGVRPGNFEDIWWNNLGVDLRLKQPAAIELCGCPWNALEESRRKRYKCK